MRQPRNSKDSTRSLTRQIRRLLGPLAAAAALVAMTVCSAWAQTVSIGNGSVLEGNAGTTTINVPLTRTGPTGQNIGLTYRTNAGGTPPATAGTDYVDLESATALLPAGATTLNLPVSINGDTDIEPDERFLVRLLSAHNAGPSIAFPASSPTFPTGNGSQSVAAADFNGDGRPDAAVVNRPSNTVSVLLNTTVPGATSPSFAPKADLVTGSNPRSVAAADLNGDGRPDLAVTNGGGGGISGTTVSVLLNTTAPGATSASFTAKVDFGVGTSPVSVTAADLDGDGRPDLAVANAGSNTVSVLRNTSAPGAATPSFAAKADFGTDIHPRSVIAADLNGDGRLDLATSHFSSNTASVLINTSAPGATMPSFAARVDFDTGSSLGTGCSSESIIAADLNGDGRPDLAVANLFSDSVSVLLSTTAPGDASPSFAPKSDFVTGDQPCSMSVADLNGDGRPDLAVTNFDAVGAASVFLNTSSPGASVASFAPKSSFATGGFPTAITAADFNGDGRPDLAATNGGDSTAAVLLNTTAAGVASVSFANDASVGVGVNPTSVVLGDLNGDGRLDLAVANAGNDNVSVRINNTAPGASITSFAAAVNFPVGVAPRSVAIGDINRDGLLDLAVVNRLSNSVSVLLNNTAPGATSASFGAATDLSVGSGPFSVALGDFNRDGALDLAVAIYNNDLITVLRNTTAPGATSASFAPVANFPVLTSPSSVAVGDFNGDGRPDLAVANFDTPAVTVLLNTTPIGTASTSFAARANFNVPFGLLSSVAVGDFNGDGRPDLTVASEEGDDVTVLLSTTTPGATVLSFAPANRFTFGSGIDPSSVAVGDLNGDGRPDLVAAFRNGSNVTVLRNTTTLGASNASFASAAILSVGSQPLSVAVGDLNGDGRPEMAVANSGSGTVSVLLNRLYPVTINGGATTATILNDDVPQLSINDVTLAEGSGGGTTAFTFTVSLPQAASGTVTLDYATADDSATVADADYAATSGSLSFAPGELSKTVTVQVNADTKFETAERFFVNLTNAVGATIGDDQGVGNISNDDDEPSVRFVQASSSVSEGVGAVNLAVELSNASYQAVSFSVSGTPAPGADYSGLTTGPISIAAGSTTATVSLTVTDDALDEAAELVSLNLTNPVNASLGSPSAHALTIQDNDDTPTVSFADASLSVNENAGTMQSRVILSAVSSQAVTLTVSVIGGSASNGADYSLPVDSTLTIPAGQTFADLSIPISNDVLDENNETISLQLFMPANATLTAPFTQLITVVDDDATPTVSFDTAGASYNENAGTVMIPVRLSSASAREVRAAFALSGSATSADFSSTTASPLVFPPNATAVNIVLSITDDTLDEDSETLIFTLGALTNADPGAQTVYTASITDDDEDTTPDAFRFMDQTNVPRNSVRTSNAVTISGITSPAAISIVGGGYSIGCTGVFTAAPGTISSGQTVCVRHTSASTYNTGMNTVLTVGDVSDTFTTVTAANAVAALLGSIPMLISDPVGTLLGQFGGPPGP